MYGKSAGKGKNTSSFRYKYLAAIIWGGIPDRIIVLGQSHILTIAMSQELLNEIETTFHKPKFRTKLQALDLRVSNVINLIRESVILYPIDEIIVPKLRDADDNIVIATAIAAQADVIITGDRNLLILSEYQGINIMTPKNFLARYFNSNHQSS